MTAEKRLLAKHPFHLLHRKVSSPGSSRVPIKSTRASKRESRIELKSPHTIRDRTTWKNFTKEQGVAENGFLGRFSTCWIVDEGASSLRSIALRVMSPARFRCATQLLLPRNDANNTYTLHYCAEDSAKRCS